jgi:hypothetical protein
VAPLLLALGRAVFAAAGLEGTLLVEVLRLRAERDGLDALPLDEITRLQRRATAGQLLTKLRGLGIPPELARRIRAAVKRRNDLVHHRFEDPELAKALMGDEASMAAVISRVERLALDCGELAVELQTAAQPKLEALSGTSQRDLVKLLGSIDLATVEDPHFRAQLEAIRALGDDLATFDPLS